MQHFLAALTIPLLITFQSLSTTSAEMENIPNLVTSPYDLVNAVNALRVTYGLPAYSISSILMSTAQNQADYMAVTGRSSHTGAGGSTVTDRLLAAGYPLDGDLSLGGWRSENITSGGENTTAQTVVDQWAGDALHLETMISPNLTEIGAGVSVNNGRVYFVIDCARPELTLPPAGVIIPVLVSTPNEAGDIIHEVQAGQTLWQIAISYGTKVDEIKRLNNLFDNNIYPGTKLFIRKNVALTPTPPGEVSTLQRTSLATLTTTVLVPTLSYTPTTESAAADTNIITNVVIGIVVVAILGGVVFARLGRTKK